MTVALAFLCGCSARVNAPTVIEAIDLHRYAGCWYEIATIPMFVQRGCVGTTATYTPKDSKTMRVVNRCLSETLDGPVRQVEGDATIPNPDEPAKLRVAFDTWWGIFARGDYWIVMLDPKYRFSVVSGPTRKRLWILSRTPELSKEIYKDILKTLEDRGFDLSELELTSQFPERDLCSPSQPSDGQHPAP